MIILIFFQQFFTSFSPQNVKKLWKLPVAISQSPRWHLVITCFVQPTVPKPKNTQLKLNEAKKAANNCCFCFKTKQSIDLLSLTLVGLGVSSDQVLKFKAVRSHLLLRLAANSRHVAVLHLTGTAAGPRVDTHPERLICRRKPRSYSLLIHYMFSVTERLNLTQHRIVVLHTVGFYSHLL